MKKLGRLLRETIAGSGGRNKIQRYCDAVRLICPTERVYVRDFVLD